VFRVCAPKGRYRAWFVVGASGPGKGHENGNRVWDVHIDAGAAHADAILRLHARPKERMAMGEQGRSLVLQRYTWATEAESLLGLYERLLRQPD